MLRDGDGRILLPEVLYRREKFAFMAPPAHTEPEKWEQMKRTGRRHYLGSMQRAIDDARRFVEQSGCAASCLPVARIRATTDAERVQMDAVINHLLGVQMLHRMFVASDLPELARQEADRLGWRTPAPVERVRAILRSSD